MVFELPSEFQKEIAKTTAKVYKTKLNKLASEGFGTVEALRSRPAEVIAAINRLSPGTGTEKERHAQRYYLCAIRWVLPKTKDKYYAYYQKILPFKVDGTDVAWVPKKRYKGPAD
jgi:hypothetical protein